MEDRYYSLQENIHAYVTGDNDATQTRQLKEQAMQDPEVAEEIAFSKSLHRALEHREMLAAHLIFNTVMEQEGLPDVGNQTSGFKWARWLMVTAVSVVLLSGGYWWTEQQGWWLSNAQQLYNNTVQPLENVLFLPQDGPGMADLSAGLDQYERGNYAAAAQTFGQLLAQRPDPNIQLYYGTALLLSGQSRQSLAPLSAASGAPEPPVQETARWYMALAYLSLDQPDEARPLLMEIPADGLYGAQAGKLLQQLK